MTSLKHTNKSKANQLLLNKIQTLLNDIFAPTLELPQPFHYSIILTVMTETLNHDDHELTLNILMLEKALCLEPRNIIAKERLQKLMPLMNRSNVFDEFKSKKAEREIYFENNIKRGITGFFEQTVFKHLERLSIHLSLTSLLEHHINLLQKMKTSEAIKHMVTKRHPNRFYPTNSLALPFLRLDDAITELNHIKDDIGHQFKPA